MVSYTPMLFADAEVTDFINRMWGHPNQPMTLAVRQLVDAVLHAQNNRTSLTFGSFTQQDMGTVASQSTEYLYITSPMTDEPIYAMIRFAFTDIKLVDSETLSNEPVPLMACNGSATNIVVGGVVRAMDCSPVGSTTSTQPQFLGQTDTSSVMIINDIFGDGTKDTSENALDQAGVDWYNAHWEHMDKLLTSRGLIIGGHRPKVTVVVHTNQAAISYLQLTLILLPIFLALIVWGATFQKPMSYYQNSFLAAVCATAHVTGRASDESECREIGYMRSPPEIVVKTKDRHVSLRTPEGELVAVPGGRRVLHGGVIFEPLVLPEAWPEADGSAR